MASFVRGTFESVIGADLRPGDRIQYRETVAKIATIDRIESIRGDDWPDSIHLQLDVPGKGRLFMGLSSEETVKRQAPERMSLPVSIPRKSKVSAPVQTNGRLLIPRKSAKIESRSPKVAAPTIKRKQR